MRLLSFLFLLFTLQVTAQTDHIRVTHKQQRFKSDSGATFIVHWDEVELPNKKAEKTINEVLTLYARNYIRSAHGYEQTTEYSPKCKVVYAKHGFISIFSTAYIYEKGAAHGWTEFNTLNYNALTGQQINFRQFITPDRLSSLEDLLMHKLTERFRDFDFDRQHYLRQLKDLQFSLSDEGIEVLFAGDTYATAIMDILITYAELESFANKQGLLKPFYQ